MQVEINSPKLVKILQDRQKLVEEVAAINKTQLEMEEDKKKLAYKIDRLKEKTQVIVEKQKLEIPQYHILARIFLQDDKAFAEILDQIEEYKKFLDDKNAPKNT
jgi:hypothetical protein